MIGLEGTLEIMKSKFLEMRNFRPKERRSYNMVAALDSGPPSSNSDGTTDYLADLGQATSLLWVTVCMLVKYRQPNLPHKVS